MDISEIKEFEQQVGTLKLSQAIRIGAKLRPQCFMYGKDSGGSCAIVAGAEGAGVPYDSIFTTGGAWTALYRLGIVSEGYDNNEFAAQIIYKQDHDHLSREQIADWVETEYGL